MDQHVDVYGSVYCSPRLHRCCSVRPARPTASASTLSSHRVDCCVLGGRGAQRSHRSGPRPGLHRTSPRSSPRSPIIVMPAHELIEVGSGYAVSASTLSWHRTTSASRPTSPPTRHQRSHSSAPLHSTVSEMPGFERWARASLVTSSSSSRSTVPASTLWAASASSCMAVWPVDIGAGLE